MGKTTTTATTPLDFAPFDGLMASGTMAADAWGFNDNDPSAELEE